MGVTKKKPPPGGRWAADGTGRTYQNYGRDVQSRSKLTAAIVKIRLKVEKFAESGKSNEPDKAWARRVCDRLDDLLGVGRNET